MSFKAVMKNAPEEWANKEFDVEFSEMLNQYVVNMPELGEGGIGMYSEEEFKNTYIRLDTDDAVPPNENHPNGGGR